MLYVCSSSHLEGGTHQHPDLASAYLGEQLLLLRITVGVVDKFDLIGGDAHLNEFTPNVIIDVEATVPLRSGQVAKYKLCRFLIRCLLPNIEDILYAGIDLASLIISQHGVNQPLIQSGLSSVVGDEEHIVLGGVHQAVMHLLGSLGKGFHQLLLHVAGLNLYNVVVCLRDGQFQHIGGLNVRRLLEHGHQFGDVEELGKACLCSVSATVGGKLDGRNRLAKGGCPRVKVEQSPHLKLVVLEVLLHGIEFNHGIGDRRTRGKDTALPSRQFVQITALHIEVGGFLRLGLRDACDISHFRVGGEVLVEMRLIHK